MKQDMTIREALAAIAQLRDTYGYAAQLTQDVDGYQITYDEQKSEWTIHPAQSHQIRRYEIRADQAQSHVETLNKTEIRLLRACLLPYVNSDMTAQDIKSMCLDESSAHYEFWDSHDETEAKRWRRAGVNEALLDTVAFALDRVASWYRRGPQVQF